MAGKCRLPILFRFCLVSLILMTVGVGQAWAGDCNYTNNNFVSTQQTVKNGDTYKIGLIKLYYYDVPTFEFGNVTNNYGISHVKLSLKFSGLHGKTEKFRLQYKVENGSWQNIGSQITASVISTDIDENVSIAGSANQKVTFRLYRVEKSTFTDVQTLTLSGFEVRMAPTVSANPTSITFGNVTYGKSESKEVTATYTLKASGNISASCTGDFSATIATPACNCSTNQQTKTVTVTFTPTTQGTRTGVLTITNPDGTTNTTVNLSGTGVRADNTITMDNTKSVDVATDKTNPLSANIINVSSCFSSQTGNGAISYSLKGGPTSLTGSTYANNCSFNSSTNEFYAWVGGTYTFTATSAQTGQYNNATKDFTVTVNRLTQNISWTPKNPETEPFVEEDVISATSIGDVTLSKSGTGAAYITIDGNTATVGEVASNTTVTLTATAAQTDVYAEATDSKTITLTSLLKQHITFNQPELKKLKTTDNPRSKELKATSDSNRDSEIYFTVSDNTEGVTVSKENGKWYLNYPATACKNITVTAHLDGVENVSVDATPVSQMIKVIDPNAACDTTEAVIKAQNIKASNAFTTGYYSEEITIPTYMLVSISRLKTGLFDIYTNGVTVEFYNNKAATGTPVYTKEYKASDINTYISNERIDLQKYTHQVKSVKFVTSATNGYKIDSVKYTHLTIAKPSVKKLDFEAIALSTVEEQSFTIEYANYQIELSIEGSSNFVIKSDDAFGDCESYDTQTVTIGYNVPAQATEEHATLYIKDNTGKELGTVALNAVVQGGLTQNITSHNIASSYWTTDLVNMTAETDRGLTNFSYVASPSDVAVIDGSQMTFIKSCDNMSITITEAGNAAYAEATEEVTNIKVNKVTPTIVTTPTGAAVTYLQTLENSVLTATNALAEVTLRGVAHSAVAGSWNWTTKSHQVTEMPGSHSYGVTFTPDDKGMYNSNTTGSVAIQVNKATQTLEMNDGSVYVKVNGLDANATDSRLDLSTLIKSQTTDPVAASRAGAVTYEVISSNKANATIDGNTFTSTVCATYTIRATQAVTDYYNLATDEFKVTVNPRKNTLTVVGSQTKYVDEPVHSVVSKKNSDATLQYSSTAEDIARYDAANNRIIVDNRDSKSFNDTLVTISIWQAANSQFEASGVKTINVTVQKHENQLSYTWEGTAHTSWSEFLNFMQSATVTFSASNTQTDCPKISVVQKSGKDNAKYVEEENKITASYNDASSATWEISQAETRTYRRATAMLIVKVGTLSTSGCDLVNIHYDTDVPASKVQIVLPETGTAGELTFTMKKDGLFADDAKLCRLVGTEWDTIHIWAKSNNSYDTPNGVSTPLTLDPNTTAIRFDKYATYTGALTFDDPFINDIRITRRTWMKLEDATNTQISELTMPTNTVSIAGSNSKTAKFYVDYSTCDSKIYLSSTHSRITVSPAEFTADNKGSKEITVTYTSSAIEDISATITVYTQYENKTLTVKAKTEKESQTINWNDGFTGNPMTLQLGLSTDNAATSSSKNPVTYTSGNDKIIKVSEDGLSFTVVGVGETTLTAHADGDDTHWKPVSETKNVTTTGKKVQYIVWNHDYTYGLHPDDVADLDAVAMTPNYQTGVSVKSDAQTALIAYECLNNMGVIQIIDGKKIKMLKEGNAQIKATLAGNDDFEAAEPVILDVHVRLKSAGNCSTPPMFLGTGALEFFAFSTSKPEVVNYVNLNHNNTTGDPDSLTFTVTAKGYEIGNVLSGNIIVYASIDGGSTWGNAIGTVIPVKDGAVPDTIILDKRTTHLKFVRPQGGTGYHYVKNIKVTRKAALTSDATLVNGLPEVNLGNVMAGAERSDVISFTYASVKGDLTTSKQNSTNVKNVLTIDEPVIELDCGAFDTHDLPITFRPMEIGQWSEEVKIEDPLSGLSYIVRVKANVTKGAQAIIWNHKTNLTFNENVTLNAYATSGLDVSYTITNDLNHITSIVGDKIVVNGVGSFTVVVNQAGNNSFAEATPVIKNFTVQNDEIVFVGSGNWTDSSQWQAGQKPGKNDDVKVTGQLTISSEHEVKSLTIVGDGSVTMVENGKLIINGDTKAIETGKSYGDLYVKGGGEVVLNGHLTVNDFGIASKYPTSAEATSGQVQESQNLSLIHNAFFDLSLDPSGTSTFGWYDFSVPFEVDALNGVYKQDGTKVNYGTNYAIIEFDEAAYAPSNRGWSYCKGTLKPGKLYSITLADGLNDLRFFKKDGAAIEAKTSLPVVSTTKADNTYQGWNGLGNTALQYAKVNNKVQIYDHENIKYAVLEENECAFIVGAAFFVHAGAAGNIDLTVTDDDSNTGLRAPKRAGRTIEEFKLVLDDNSGIEQDRLYFSADEDAVNAYQIGHDLVKFGTLTEAKMAQMWANAYGKKLCDVEMPLHGDRAETPVSFFAPTAGEYTLSIAKQPDDASLFLTQNGMIIWNLSLSNYTLELEKGTTEGYGLMLYPNMETTTDIETAEGYLDNKQATKLMINGQLFILRDGRMYDGQGKSVK